MGKGAFSRKVRGEVFPLIDRNGENMPFLAGILTVFKFMAIILI